MAMGLETFLEGLGALTKRERRQAARTAAKAFAEELAFGTFLDPASVVKPMAVKGDLPAAVWIRGVAYVSVCPHHLLPVRGVAHLAYIPRDTVAPLGHLARLIQVAAARLILQEDLAGSISDAVSRSLDAVAAACLVEARHDCLELRGAKALESSVATSAYSGRGGKKILEVLLAKSGS